MEQLEQELMIQCNQLNHQNVLSGVPSLRSGQALAVILSAAKDLCARRARPFAALRVTLLKLRRKEFQIWIKHVSSSCTVTGMQPIT
jgi:hypothetical protein